MHVDKLNERVSQVSEETLSMISSSSTKPCLNYYGKLNKISKTFYYWLHLFNINLSLINSEHASSTIFCIIIEVFMWVNQTELTLINACCVTRP